jgi:hypothetical protein
MIHRPVAVARGGLRPRYLFVALRNPAPRRVFRPARRVSWGTRIFALLVFLLAVGSVVAFLEVVLPARAATLAQQEAGELALAKRGAEEVSTSLNTVWAELSNKGSMTLTDAQITTNLARAKSAEKAASDALGHVQLAEAYLAEADGLPFQLHAPAIIASDRPSLKHMDRSLTTALRLAHAANLQLTIARHMRQDMQSITGTLDPSLNARSWTAAARSAADLATDLKAQETAAADPEALLDPLWSKWVESTMTYVNIAQQYSLASAGGQNQAAQQLAKSLAAARDQLAATKTAAQNAAAAWQQKTIQPLLSTMASEIAAAAS